MCIISDPVNRVAATKLFAMPSRDGKRHQCNVSARTGTGNLCL